MCVQFAIHDSENDKGQRNLHCHIMLTLRSIDEHGHWMPKQKKVYVLDDNGERIPDLLNRIALGKTAKQVREEHGLKPGTSDPTFNEAATNIMIEDAFKTGKVDKGFLKGIKDASLYEEEIQLVSLMRMDFELLEEIIEDLDESDSKIMKQYLLEGRLFKEIADDEGRTYEAINLFNVKSRSP